MTKLQEIPKDFEIDGQKIMFLRGDGTLAQNVVVSLIFKDDGVEMKYYRCPFCAKYHLTKAKKYSKRGNMLKWRKK